MAWVEQRTDKRGRAYFLVAHRDPVTGKKKRRRINGTRQGTIDAALRRAREIEGGTLREPEERPASDALEAYLTHRRAELAPSTATYYESLLRPLVAHLGTRPMRSWSPMALVEYLNTRTAWGAGTRRALIHAVRNFEAWCEAMEIETARAGKRTPLPKHQPSEVQPFTLAEIDAILGKALEIGSPLEVLVALGVYAGLAYADAMALTWDQVDLAAGRITGRRVKTGVPYLVTVCEPLAEVLRRHRAVGGPVCRGLHLTPGANRKAYVALCKAAKVDPGPKGQRFHRLRHTFATLAGRAGLDLGSLQRAVGHKQGSAETLRYSHPSEDAMRKHLGEAFGRKAKPVVIRRKAWSRAMRAG